jgi:hypothetical protein
MFNAHSCERRLGPASILLRPPKTVAKIPSLRITTDRHIQSRYEMSALLASPYTPHSFLANSPLAGQVMSCLEALGTRKARCGFCTMHRSLPHGSTWSTAPG